MIKRTLYFGNPAYLSLKLKQLVVRLPQADGEQKDEKELTRTVPIEDLGVIILDHKQITITQALLAELLDLTYNLEFALQALLVMAEDLDVVIEETDNTAPKCSHKE